MLGWLLGDGDILWYGLACKGPTTGSQTEDRQRARRAAQQDRPTCRTLSMAAAHAMTGRNMDCNDDDDDDGDGKDTRSTAVGSHQFLKQCVQNSRIGM